MIDLGRAPYHGEGVTLFPDHAEAGRFHYVPDRPRLRVGLDGTPELSLLKYRLDPTLHDALGAGMLAFTVDLGVDEERLERVRRRLRGSGLAGPAQLVPVGADAGRCELVLIDRSSRDDDAPAAPAAAPSVGFGLVERILGAAAPALYGDNAATFQAVLSAEGVALVEGALRGGGLPAGVVYALEVTGLRPALRARITARWRDVYHFYENRLHGGKLLLAVDVGPTVEELVHAEAISVEVDELVPPDERSAVYQRALDEIQRYVLEEMFRPTLGQAPPAEDAGDDALATIGRAIKDLAGFFSITYSLREVDRNELKTFRYELGVARAERLTLSPQGTFSILLGPETDATRLDRLIVTVEPAASAEMRFDVGVLTSLDAEEIDHVEVVLRYGEQRESLVLDGANPRRSVTIWHRQELGPAVHYRYEVHFRAGTAGHTDVLRSEERSTETRVIRLNPRELYQRVSLRAVAQGLPFDRYPLVLVDVRAHDPIGGWSVAETLELSAPSPEATVRVRASLEARVWFERRLRYLDVRGDETTLDWEEAEPGVMVVGDPRPEVIDVQILASARFATVVRRLVVELRPRAEPERVATRVLTADQPAATWSWTAAADASREYEYRVTVHTTLNEVREGRWLPGAAGKLVVGEGIARLRQVELMLVGRSLKDLGLLALKVRFAFADHESGLTAEDEMLVEDTRKPITWSYPVADTTRQTYTYQLTSIAADGAITVQEPRATSDLLVVHPLV
jgi:hypothetical protein